MTTAVRTTTQTDRTNTMEVGIMEDNRRELNQAIWYVITSGRPKKEMKGKVRLLKKAGYTLYKADTNKWGVTNYRTNRQITASKDYGWNGDWKVYNSFRRKITVKFGTDPKIDFVGLLEKPLNLEWESRPERVYQGTRSRALKRYETLQQKKRYVRYDEDDIKRIQKQIEELQASLMRQVEFKVKAQAELDNYRREVGLRVRR